MDNLPSKKESFLGPLTFKQVVKVIIILIFIFIIFKVPPFSNTSKIGQIPLVLVVVFYLFPQLVFVTKFDNIDEKWIVKRKQNMRTEKWPNYLKHLITSCESDIIVATEKSDNVKVDRLKQSLHLLQNEALRLSKSNLK